MIDKATIELIAKSLNKSCRGKENAIQRDVLLNKLANAKNPIILDRVQLDQIMHEIRKKNFVDGILIESGRSYYVTNDQEDIQNYIKYLQIRAEEILQIRTTIMASLKKQKSGTESNAT